MFILEHKPGSLTLIRLGFLKVAFPEGVGGGGGGGVGQFDSPCIFREELVSI